MQEFIEFLNRELPDEKGNKVMFKFKRKTLDSMNDRYVEVLTRGVTNEKVMKDLVISEHSDLKAEFEDYKIETGKKKRAKARLIFNVVGTVVVILSLVVIYLAVSFVTQDWRHTWIIIVDGILLWIAYLLSFGVNRICKMKRIFHVIARVMMAIDTMVVAVAVFLFSLDIFHIEKSWVLVILGVMSIFIADLVFATVTKQRMVIINYLIYLPVIAAMLYVILGGLGIVAWHFGWVFIIIALVVDLIVIRAAIAKNKHVKAEVEDIWKEN